MMHHMAIHERTRTINAKIEINTQRMTGVILDGWLVCDTVAVDPVREVPGVEAGVELWGRWLCGTGGVSTVYLEIPLHSACGIELWGDDGTYMKPSIWKSNDPFLLVG